MRRIAYEFDPIEEFDVKIPKSARKEALEEVANYVKEEVLSYVGEGVSPVAGYGKFPGLSAKYKAYKKEHSSSPIPNLELTGDMLDSLECVRTQGKISLQIVGPEAAKADGHCQLIGTSALPLRRFIPASDETFKKKIRDGIRSILSEYEDSNDG